jgi:hypothetical protein
MKYELKEIENALSDVAELNGFAWDDWAVSMIKLRLKNMESDNV